jgi:hypothetical protein
MKPRIVPILVAGALMAVGAAPAFGDAGAPGTTFPEQPGTNIQAGCTAVTQALPPQPSESLGFCFGRTHAIHRMTKPCLTHHELG